MSEAVVVVAFQSNRGWYIFVLVFVVVLLVVVVVLEVVTICKAEPLLVRPYAYFVCQT